jgi:hypothetical protein
MNRIVNTCPQQLPARNAPRRSDRVTRARSFGRLVLYVLMLIPVPIAVASFGPPVRIDHEYRPDHSCINVAITVGPGAPSSQPIYVAFQDDSFVDIVAIRSDIMFQKSSDGGQTWLPTDVLIRDGYPHAYEPDITTDSDGNIYIVWEDWYVDSVPDRRILCSGSSDGGTTWTAPARVDDRLTGVTSGDAHIAADSAGNLFCAWGDGRAGIGHVWSSVSTDRGATWSTNVQVDDDTNSGPGRPDVFVQPGTNQYLVAAQIPRRVGSHWEAGTALYRSTDMGQTFQPGVHIDTSEYDTRHPHIAADRDHIICDYFSEPYRVGDTIIAEARTFYTQGDSWGIPARMTNLDSLHELYYSGHLAISGDGGVHTALTVDNSVNERENIYYTASSDHGVSWSDLEFVSNDTTVCCQWPDIAANSNGHACIVWYQPSAQSGEIWFATNAPLGIAEAMSSAELRAPIGSPSVVRGVLFLAERPSSSASTSSLFDTGGREVLDLSPGANDVSKLAPGVYFVRAVSRELSAVSCQKVIVTR